MNTSLLDPNLDQVARPLGHLVAEFNFLELDTARLIASLLDEGDEVAAVFTATLSYSDKLMLIQRLTHVKIQDSALRDQIDAALAAARRVNTDRNRYVHAEFLPVVAGDDELIATLTRRLRARPNEQAQPTNDQEIAAIANSANAVAMQMRVIAARLEDWRHDGECR